MRDIQPDFSSAILWRREKNYECDLENFPLMDFEESVKAFEKSDKPILVYFSGFGCVNCRKLDEILRDEVGLDKIKSKYNLISLYLDDRMKLPEFEWFEAPWGSGSSKIKTKGGVNQVVQFEKLRTGTQPDFVIMNKGNKVTKSGFK
ncbi:MAG: thiol-disulfide isomerase/thioredoxin [Saprospiraceae bacterium]|jgi:thiol-disulfide isomerase/thioredoxin